MFSENLLRKAQAVDETGIVIAKHQGNVESIKYEIYEVTWEYEGQTRTGNEEFTVITYNGGAYTAVPCNATSYSAILRDVTQYLEHGNYDHSRYESVKQRGTQIY